MVKMFIVFLFNFLNKVATKNYQFLYAFKLPNQQKFAGSTLTIEKLKKIVKYIQI